MANHFVAKMEGPRALPSATTVYRHRLTAHVAFLLALKEESASRGSAVSYRMVDASPVGGREWVNSSVMEIQTANLAVAWADAQTLYEMGTMDKPTHDQLERQRAAADRLTRTLRRRIGTPVSVGAGRASVLHKLHAVLHSDFLERLDWPSVAEAANQTLSWTTDFGVESLMTAVPRFRISDMFPWTRRTKGDLVWVAEEEEDVQGQQHSNGELDTL